MSKSIPMIGKKFGRLIVVSEAENRSKNKYRKYWNCSCECGGDCVVEGMKLRSGHTQSCGCLQKERTSKARSLMNTVQYIDEQTVAICDEKNNKCLLDVSDYLNLKNFYWRKGKQGYWIAFNKGSKENTCLRMHNVIIFGLNYSEVVSENKMCDHINGDRSDNRKTNLRIVDRFQNNRNLSTRKDNTSGYHGMHYNKFGEWETYINYDNIRITLGRFHKKKYAIVSRMIAEYILYNEYSRLDCKKIIDEQCLDKKELEQILSNVVYKINKRRGSMLQKEDYEIWLYGGNYDKHSTK